MYSFCLHFSFTGLSMKHTWACEQIKLFEQISFMVIFVDLRDKSCLFNSFLSKLKHFQFSFSKIRLTWLNSYIIYISFDQISNKWKGFSLKYCVIFTARVQDTTYGRDIAISYILFNSTVGLHFAKMIFQCAICFVRCDDRGWPLK